MNASPDRAPARRSRVLITGVSGFLGRHLAPTLLAQGHWVCGVRLDEGAPVDGVVEHRVDILDLAELRSVVEQTRPDVVVHLAGLSHVGRSWDQMPQYFAVNVLGVDHVLAAAGGARVIFSSSSEVYGAVPAEDQPIPEARRPAPRNPYALTKAAAERLVLAAGGVVVRTFNLIGPGQEPIFALPSFAEQLARAERSNAKPVIRVGNLEARRDLVHVADGAEGFAALVENGEGGEIYNLGSGTATSIRQALDRLIEISGLAATVEVEDSRLRPVDIPLLRADSSKLARLGWRPERGVDSALEELWTEARARALATKTTA